MPSHTSDLKFCYGESETKLIANKTMTYLPVQDTAIANPDWVDDFSYTFNSYGFRSDEFEEDTNSIMFLGCSHTMGVGLPYDKIWCHLVAESMGMRYFNLGVGAGSLDSIFRVFSEWYPIIKSKYVVMQKPAPRAELFAGGASLRITPHQGEHWHLLLDEDYQYLNEKKNILAMRQIFPELIVLTEDNFHTADPIDRARDNQHYGYKCHEKFAEEALRHLNK